MNAPHPQPRDVKVSVCMITYNQERFIAQAIESVLMQETDFPVELVIGDDCSTDGTRHIVQDLAARYPEKIRALLHTRNLGPEHSPGKNNFVSVLKACTGKYIALLEGDDYWTDQLKLQKQAEYLEVHPECSMCFHPFTVCFEDSSRPPYVAAPPRRGKFCLEDLLLRNFIGTLTVMFRRTGTQELPGWYFELATGDWPLHILNAQYGDIGYIDSLMAVYRVHCASMWSSNTHVQRARAVLQMYHQLRPYLAARYKKSVQTGMARGYLALAAAHADQGDISEARTSLQRSIAECPMNGLRQLMDVIALVLRLYAPSIHGLLKKIRTSGRVSVPPRAYPRRGDDNPACEVMRTGMGNDWRNDCGDFVQRIRGDPHSRQGRGSP